MEQGNGYQGSPDELARLLAAEHRRHLAEREAREWAEQAAVELEELLENERSRVEADRRAGAIINQWLHSPRARARRSHAV